jgi:hypothetical protein
MGILQGDSLAGAGLVPAQGDHKGRPYVPLLLGNSGAQTLRHLDRVQGRKTKIISYGPNPEAGGVVRMGRYTIHQDFIRTSDFDLGGRVL